MFAANQDIDGQRKNTTHNVEQTGEFVWNMATWDLREAVNTSAAQTDAEVDEFVAANLEKQAASTVNVAMVKASPIKFECRYYSTLRLPGNPPMGSVDVVIGKVVGVHIDESVLTDGKVDLGKAQPIARCGYHEYVVVKSDALFEMVIPGDPRILIGLEGNAEQAKSLR
jgi:flavin reductase (DIM6/NTAB) family NADH-FMN oxidoreductase RutF